MTAYIVFIRESPVTDSDAMDAYRAAGPGVAASGDWKLTPLAAYGPMETLEGEAADGVVLLEFPTMADARAWYDSPAYAEARAHRLKAAPYRAYLFEGR
ncbi:MAG TPA: DUF1330 domain-containing protein [Sphingobium sp.]|uniref:DUF1330 domain-containing protein n=1 Tax=Sphingobium sp. TaxID=1912891 RepID=UPI002ED324F3